MLYEIDETAITRKSKILIPTTSLCVSVVMKSNYTRSCMIVPHLSHYIAEKRFNGYQGELVVDGGDFIRHADRKVCPSTANTQRRVFVYRVLQSFT